MPTASALAATPRKQPVQARSTATVEAILDATVQVLIAIGKERLTTTRVAQRAGVSVGTLYQYFPNKRSLLEAALRRNLTAVTEAVEKTCIEARGMVLCDMVAAIVETFFQAKLKDPKASLALYSVSSDVDGIRILESLRIRNTEALTSALASSPEPLTISLDLAAFMLQAAMTGVSRRLLESNIGLRQHDAVRRELISMLCAYVAGTAEKSKAAAVGPRTARKPI